jgi:hypothetical protein
MIVPVAQAAGIFVCKNILVFAFLMISVAYNCYKGGRLLERAGSPSFSMAK